MMKPHRITAAITIGVCLMIMILVGVNITATKIDYRVVYLAFGLLIMAMVGITSTVVLVHKKR